MNKSKITIILLIISAVIFSCGGKKNQEMSVEKAISVTVAPIERRDISLEVIYTGSLEGEKQAKIFSSIPEAVVNLPVREGSMVTQGQAVIILDKSGSTSRYNQAKAVLAEARDNFNKMENLYKSGAISEQAYISSRTAFEVAEANFESARQQVELTSPITGILTDLSVNVGEYAQPGLPLATIALTGTMRLVIYVESRNIEFIKKGQVAKITVDTMRPKDSGFTGTIKEVSKSADPETRLFRVEIVINNPEGILRPGMFARAMITISNLKDVLTIPRESVFSIDGINKVYVVKNDEAVERSIVVSEMTEEYAIIGSGLDPNDTVIVLGRNLVEDGSKVAISDINNNSGREQTSEASTDSEG